MHSSALGPHSAIERISDSTAQWLERHVTALLTVLTFLFAIRTVAWDEARPLWLDEIFTEHIARLGSPSAIWAALAAGLDTNPPLSYVLTSFTHRLAGPGTLAARLPENAGFWLMCLCLFAFVRHRTSAVFGLAALLFPLATRALAYSYEARPYGLLLGFIALAVLCWQRAEGGRHRNLAIAGMWAGMVLATSTNYFAVLALPPLMIGQFWRDFSRHRVDLPVWAALLLSPLPLIAFRPLFAGSMALSSGFWAHPSLSALVHCYTDTYVVGGWPISIILLMAAMGRRTSKDLPHCDGVLAAAFLIMPLELLVMSWITHALFFRYVLAIVIGVAIATVFLCHRVFQGSAISGLVLCGVFLAIFAVQEVSAARTLIHRKQAMTGALSSFLKTRTVPVPIVIDSGQFFADLFTNGPRDTVERVRYLDSPEDALRFLGTNTNDIILQRLGQYVHLPVESGPAFLKSCRQFWLYVPEEAPSWVLSKLTNSGSSIEFFDRTPAGDTLFLVTQGEPQIPQRDMP